MTGQVESFELESSKSASSTRYALLVDDSTKRNSWYQHVRPLLRTRAIVMALAGIMIVIVVSTIPSRSGSFGLAERGDNENTTTAFLIGDIRTVGTCFSWHTPGNLGVLPFGEELDRTVCENDIKARRHDLKSSETLRCYNVTQRWCFINDLPEGFVFDDPTHYSDLCIHRFFDHGGILYTSYGQQMPEAFNARCSDQVESYLIYTVVPITGCGKDYRYRFCDKQGNIDWDMVNGVGPFNCREFNAIDVYQMGREDDSVMEDLCKEQTKGCVDRLQLACKDGHFEYYLVQPEVDPKRECHNTAHLEEYSLEWGRTSRLERREDLICFP